ncbi:hypothetical protein HUJ04_011885 [Dendroctonus ponderosae]|nr:hypothetical protein HUJ04_011885 [Dendroctonus ponderosae]
MNDVIDVFLVDLIPRKAAGHDTRAMEKIFLDVSQLQMAYIFRCGLFTASTMSEDASPNQIRRSNMIFKNGNALTSVVPEKLAALKLQATHAYEASGRNSDPKNALKKTFILYLRLRDTSIKANDTHLAKQVQQNAKIQKQLMEKGSSQSWRDVLFQATGDSRLDGSALREYFRPLEDWLRNENLRTGEFVGWLYDGDYCKQSIETAGLQGGQVVKKVKLLLLAFCSLKITANDCLELGRHLENHSNVGSFVCKKCNDKRDNSVRVPGMSSADIIETDWLIIAGDFAIRNIITPGLGTRYRAVLRELLRRLLSHFSREILKDNGQLERAFDRNAKR